MTQIIEKVQLGETDMWTSPMGIGTWSWGDRFFWGYGESHTIQDIEEAFKICQDGGINFFDGAEIYGFGQNEKLLRHLLRESNPDIIIATKLFPFPWRVTRSSILRGIRASTERLSKKPIDLIQHHWPFPPLSIEHWMKAMAEAYQQGLIRSIGVSNYNLPRMHRAIDELEKHGLHLTSNQVHFSLLHQAPQWNGLLEACQKENTTLIAYSPLGQGLLTGKYKPGNPLPKGMMRLGNKELIEKLQPLIALMREIGQDHGGKTPAQVAINWVICKDAIPIAGAKNARQALENLGALGWSLTKDQILALENASKDLQISFAMENIAGLG
jgi:aryl-alcohol dehydrogenase-like predicted oxidoreductase